VNRQPALLWIESGARGRTMAVLPKCLSLESPEAPLGACPRGVSDGAKRPAPSPVSTWAVRVAPTKEALLRAIGTAG
jgi:hypothetical protein